MTKNQTVLKWIEEMKALVNPDQVAAGGGGNQNALAILIGALEENVVGPFHFALVHQIIFAAVGQDGEGLFRHHFVDLIALHAGSVDDILGFHIALIGVDHIIAVESRRLEFLAGRTVHALMDHRTDHLPVRHFFCSYLVGGNGALSKF